MPGTDGREIAMERVVFDETLPMDDVEHWIGIGCAMGAVSNRLKAFYLHAVEERRLYVLRGCASAVQYARVRWGMSRTEAHELLATGRRLRELPAIDRAFADGELTWSKVRMLARKVGPEHEAAWLERARNLSIEELSRELKGVNPGEAPRAGSANAGLPEITLRIPAADVPPELYAKWEQARRKLEDAAGRSLPHAEILDAMLDAVLAGPADDARTEPSRPLEYAVHINKCSHCEHASVETEDGPVPITPAAADLARCTAKHVDENGHKMPRLPRTADRRRLLVRDGHRCRCCGSLHGLQPHHVTPWREGGPTTLDNELTLCRCCHALVHDGLIIIDGDGPQRWRFVDRDGNNLHGPPEQTGATRHVSDLIGDAMRHLARTHGQNGNAEIRRGRMVQFEDVPDRIDAQWMQRHAHLLEWRPGGRVTFTAGPPRPDEPRQRTATGMRGCGRPEVIARTCCGTAGVKPPGLGGRRSRRTSARPAGFTPARPDDSE